MILKFPILKIYIRVRADPIVIAAETKSAIVLKFINKLYVKIPNMAENAVIPSIIIMVLTKSKLTKFLFFSIKIFNIEEVNDINTYPTIKAKVPMYLGRKYMHTIKIPEDIA